MKAAVYRRYGSPEVIRIEDVAKPVPAGDEVLIRIRATTVSSADWRLRSLTVPPGFGFISRLVFGVFKPRKPILGTELAGEIEAVGEKVTRFEVGDAVFAYPDSGLGCHAEYRTVPENGKIALKPANLSFEEAAAMCFGGATALYYLRDVAGVKRTDKVLIVGASGAVGSAAVQLAKYFGAEVTGVCSTANVDLAKSLGADYVVDYTRENVAQRGETWDIVLDTIGDMSFSNSSHLLKAGGRLLLLAAGLPQMLEMLRFSWPDDKRMFAGPSKDRPEDLLLLKTIAETGKFRPVVERCYSLGQIVEAHAHVEAGHKKGSVVIVM